MNVLVSYFCFIWIPMYEAMLLVFQFFQCGDRFQMVPALKGLRPGYSDNTTRDLTRLNGRRQLWENRTHSWPTTILNCQSDYPAMTCRGPLPGRRRSPSAPVRLLCDDLPWIFLAYDEHHLHQSDYPAMTCRVHSWQTYASQYFPTAIQNDAQTWIIYHIFS